MSNLSKFSNSCNYPSTYTFSTFTQPNDINNSNNNNNNDHDNNEDKDRSIRSGRSPLLPTTSELLSDNEESENESETENENLMEDENNVGKSAHHYVTKFNAVGMTLVYVCMYVCMNYVSM